VKYKRRNGTRAEAAIVEAAVFDHVQALLKRNGARANAPVRTEFGALPSKACWL